MIDLLLDGVRTIFSFIDKMVVFVIEYLYQLIVAIADTNVFGNLIYKYLSRIYVFLGIFMVFKLSISMINYVINPDALTDKGKGFGKLISNVIISLILLVATPTLFEVAFDIQTDLLKTNAVYQIVTGYELNNEGDSLYTNAKETGENIAFSVFSAFVYESQKNGLPYCDKDEVNTEKENICDGTCKDINNGGSTDCLLAGTTVRNDSNTYWWLLSTAVGLVVAYIFLTFCFDVALRSVKLGFLQIVAPIPIMLRMDPGAKDDKFSKWLKEVGSTFLSLFIRLAGLFFAIDIIRLVMNKTAREGYDMLSTYSGYESSGLLGAFTTLFIIIGCLMFAKKLPQLISDLFGIKLDGGGFSLKKKVGDIPGMGLAKMAGAGALGFAGGMAANTLAAGKNFSWNRGQGFWKNMGNNALGLGKSVGSMAAGGVSGLGRGAFSKEKSMWKAGSAGVKGAVDKRNLRADRVAAGDGGPKGYIRRAGVGISNWAGIQSGASKYDKQLSAYDSFLKQHSALDSYVEGELAKGKGRAETEFEYKGQTYKNNINTLKAAAESIVNNPNATPEQIATQQAIYQAALKQAKIDYVDDGQDNAVKNMISEMNYIRENNSTYEGFSAMGEITSGSDWDSSKGKIKAAQSDVKVSEKYRKSQVNKKMDAKK